MPDFTLEHRDPKELMPNPLNWRRHPEQQRNLLRYSLDKFDFVQGVVYNGRTQRLIDGHARVEEAIEQGRESIPVNVVDLSEEDERELLRLFDPIGALAETDTEALDRLIAEIGNPDLEAMLSGMEPLVLAEANGGGSGGSEQARQTLAERFGIPPFSVLDARQGYWQERKRAWIALGIQSELGRGPVPPPGGTGPNSIYRQRGGQRESDFSRSGAVVSNGPGGLKQPLLEARGYANASPGGSPRDAAKLENGKTVRGDGKGRRITPGQQGGKSDLWDPAGPAQRERYEKGLTWGKGANEYDHDRDRNKRQGSADFGTPGMAYDGGPMPEDAPAAASGTSIFDPVLCELAYRWFCPEEGRILDPFAGGSVRGIVAGFLGRSYVGVDLSERQIEANRQQAQQIGVSPEWIVGDSREALPEGEFDFVFSCPPYADLEVYSDDPRDLSTLDYPEFLSAYRQIIAGAVSGLKENRFACFVVGDVRDPKGFYRNFVSDTIAAFQDAGMRLYNEAVLVTAVGSLPIRVGKQFGAYRKLGKTHQNVLVFYNGDPKRIKEIAADCEWGELAEEGAVV